MSIITKTIRWYPLPVFAEDAWADGGGWGRCIACHCESDAPVLVDGREVEGVNPWHLTLVMDEACPASMRCVRVGESWQAV